MFKYGLVDIFQLLLWNHKVHKWPWVVSISPKGDIYLFLGRRDKSFLVFFFSGWVFVFFPFLFFDLQLWQIVSLFLGIIIFQPPESPLSFENKPYFSRIRTITKNWFALFLGNKTKSQNLAVIITPYVLFARPFPSNYLILNNVIKF